MRPPSISRLRNLPLRFCAGLGLIALGACTESDQGEMGPQAFLGVPAPGGLELPPLPALSILGLEEPQSHLAMAQPDHRP